MNQTTTHSMTMKTTTTTTLPRNNRIKVVARIRPTLSSSSSSHSYFSSSQKEPTPTIVPSPDHTAVVLLHTHTNNHVQYFDLDHVFSHTCTQSDVYDGAVGDAILTDLLKGFNTTIFAYGQTGSGKSYTMGSSSLLNCSYDYATTSPVKSPKKHMHITHAHAHDHVRGRRGLRKSALSLSPMKTKTSKSSIIISQQQLQSKCKVQEILQRSMSSLSLYDDIHKNMNKNMNKDDNDNNDENWMINQEEDGILQRAIRDIFRAKERHSGEVNISMSYVEVYNDEILDLLHISNSGSTVVDDRMENGSGNRPALQLREASDGTVEVVGMQTVEVKSPQQICNIIKYASMLRLSSATNCNEASSRSHALCTFQVTVSPSLDVMTSSVSDDNMEESDKLLLSTSSEIITAKLTLVDLAGCERIKVSGVEGLQQHESIMINKDLLTLGKVISALADRNQAKSAMSSRRLSAGHVPYRDSKLTRLLKESLGGNCYTIMVACLSPMESNLDETINTLRYAQRTRSIENSAVRNAKSVNLTPEQSALILRENRDLKVMLMRLKTQSNQSDKQKQLMQEQMKSKIAQLEAQLQSSTAEYVTVSRLADKYNSKLARYRVAAQDAGFSGISPLNSPKRQTASPKQQIGRIQNISPARNNSLRKELEDVKRERDFLRSELLSTKRQRLELKENSPSLNSGSMGQLSPDSRSFNSSPFTPLENNKKFTLGNNLEKRFMPGVSPKSSVILNTPDSARKVEIRANAKELIQKASLALRSAKKCSAHPNDDKENSCTASISTSLDKVGNSANIFPCSCRPDVRGDSARTEFFLPKISDCKCGRSRKNVVTSDLSTIFRPWQVQFLSSIGITTAQALVKSYSECNIEMSSALFMWKRGNDSHDTVATKKSCGIALHIWSRLATLLLQGNHNIEKDKQKINILALSSI